MTSTTSHRLPGDPGTGDTNWFSKRQNAFEQSVILQQVGFKRSHLPEMQDGPFSKQPMNTYPHIMPPGNERLAFYGGFATDVLECFHTNDIALHTEALNLKSSQVACINFLFPFYQHPSRAPSVLRNLFPDIATLDRLEFEYTGQEEGSVVCTDWLGEPMSGKRGQNRTSIDAAIFWTDTKQKAHISLIEWKYTERSFGSCSAYQKADKADKKFCRCLDVLKCPAEECLVAKPGRNRGRKYWAHMSRAGIDLTRLVDIKGCPFQGPFYQLMRQFLVAQFLRENRIADHVEVVSLEFAGNLSLRAVPVQLQPLCDKPDDTVVDAWNSAIKHTPLMRRITAEQLLAGYDTSIGIDRSWRQYILDRYGI